VKVLQMCEFKGLAPVCKSAGPLSIACRSLAPRLGRVVDQHAPEHNTLP
jgi:hypothetical protein